MTATDLLLLVVAIALFLFSVVLALAETSFVRMNRIRALSLADDGRKGAARLARMLEHPERTLNVVLLMVLITQLGTATLVGVLVDGLFGPWGVVIGIVVQVFVFFVIGEVAPKTFAIQNTDRAALSVSGLLWALTVFPPLRLLSQGLIGLANVVLPGRGIKEGPFVTEEEIRTMADVAAAEDSIEREERRLIHSIFEFGDAVVREAMTPRPDMVMIDADAPMEEAVELAIAAGFSRLPVVEGSPDDVAGLVYLKDLVRRVRAGEGRRAVRESMRPAVFVPEQKRLAELLAEMQKQRFHMAVVVDEYGGTAGLVTLEDLLEEIVGEITDEYDVAEPTVETLPDGSVRVPARVPVDDLSELLGVELPDTEWDTVGGLVLNLMGHVPAEGEAVTFQGLEFRVERVQGRRVVSVLVSKRPLAEQPAGS